MNTGRYVVRPLADRDLEAQAWYYGLEAGPELGHRFLTAAHDTFARLAVPPGMGRRCQPKRPELVALRLFPIKGFRRIVVVYLPRPYGIDILRVVHGSRDLQILDE